MIGTTVYDNNTMLTNELYIRPKYRIPGLNDRIRYPVLTYKTCTDPDLVRPSTDTRYLISGATWTDWIDKPWYEIRVAAFEKCLWPYDMPKKSLWKSINGALLLYTPNLQTLIDIRDPDVVYYKRNNVIRIRITFTNDTSIEFMELVV